MQFVSKSLELVSKSFLNVNDIWSVILVIDIQHPKTAPYFIKGAADKQLIRIN